MTRRGIAGIVVPWLFATTAIACGGTPVGSTAAPSLGAPSGPPTTEAASSAAPSTVASTPADLPASDGAATEPPTLGEVHAVMAATIAADRPLLRFDFHPDRLDGSWILDGNADDGVGPGRLLVVVSPRRGDLTAHPCGDPDFRQGGRCVERERPDGDRLVLRDQVTGGGVTTVLAVLIHPDRSGITAEASNQAIDFTLGPIGPGPVEPPPVTRPAPLYTALELGTLVLVIDAELAAVGPPPS
jgi:hypothetical protein